jgi:tetratricopeptide (TPR) repeat protein
MLDNLRCKFSAKGRPGPPSVNNSLVHGLLIVIVSLAAYSNTFHVPFQFDDIRSITDMPLVKDWRSSLKLLSSPRAAGFLSFALNYRIHGTDVVGYHIINLIIHIINAFFVYALIVLSFRTAALKASSLRDHARPIALFTALLFVSHPIQTQAVTYIVQRFASLATLWYLLSLVTYIRSRLLAVEEPSRRRWLPWYVVSLVSAVLAMKTKEMAFTLPAVIMLYEFLFFSGPVKKRILMLLPLLLTMGILPAHFLGASGSLGDMIGDVSAATRLETSMTREVYLFTQFTVIVTYLRLLFFPVNQNLDYDYPLFRSFFTPEVAFSFLLLLLLLGAGVYIVYRGRRSPGAGRLAAFGVLWFFMTLSVESSVIPIVDVIFEHRVYLPSIGFFLAGTSALFLGAERLTSRWAEAEQAVMAVLAAGVVICTGLTYARNTVWRSQVSLWEDVIEKSPLKARGYNGLGLAYHNLRQHDKAIDAYIRAITLNPAYAVAYNNLGISFYEKGLYDRAIEAQTRAIVLSPAKAAFHDHRGLSHAAKGEYDRAVVDYTKAIALDPAHATAYHNLGYVYHLQGRYEQAIGAFTKALTVDPANALFHNNRALSYAARGDFDRAIEDYVQAITLKPDMVDAYNGRGVIHGTLGRYNEAIADFSRAISLSPNTARYYANRGAAYALIGRKDEALSDFQRLCDQGDAGGCERLVELKQRGR